MWHLDRLCSNAQASSSSSRPHGDASTSAWGTGFSMCMASMRQRRMVRALVASGPHVRSRKCSRTTGSKDSFPSRDELPGSPAAARAPATSSRSRDTRHSTDQRAAHGARRVAAAAVLSPPLLVRPQPPPQQQKPKPAPASERVTAPQPPQASERPSTGQHKQRGSHSRQHSSSADIREAPHGAASSQESSRSPHRQRMPGGDVRATTASRSATSCPSPPDMLLSQYLKSCQSWRELQEAVARAGPDALNHIHLTAVASGLAKMAPGPQADSAEHAAFASFAASVLPGVVPHLAACGPRELSTLLWAAAKVQGMCASAKGAPVHLVVTGVWVSALLAQAQQQLRRFNPQDISMLLWAVAELSTLPSAGASAQLQHQQASARSQGATGASKGAAGKSRPPSDASESDPPLDGTLVNLPPGFLPAVLEASQATLHQAGPQALSNTLWALATLRSPPPPQWLSAFMKHSTQQLRDAAPQALANIGWALATMGVSERTTPEWRRAYLEASAAAAAYAPPISLAQSTWAVARLRLKPGAEWVEGVQNASASRLASFASQDLSNLIWGLASVGARPNIAWMDAFLRSVRSQLRSFNAGELGSIMWALATLRFHPGEATLRPMLAAFAERMPSAGAPALMCVLWACARLRVVPDPLWMEEWLSTLSADLGDIGPQELACCWWALGMLRVRPPAWLASDLVAELKLQHGAMHARELVMVLVGYARLGAAPQRDGLDSLMSQLVRQVRGLVTKAPAHVPRTVASALSALAHIARTSNCGRAVSQEPAIRALLKHAARAQAVCAARARAGKAHGVQGLWRGSDLAVALHALARLRQVPPPGWLRAALRAASGSQNLPVGSAKGAAGCPQGAVFRARDLAMAAWGVAQLCSLGGSSSRKLRARAKARGSAQPATGSPSRKARHAGKERITFSRVSKRWRSRWRGVQRLPRRLGHVERAAWVRALLPHLHAQPAAAWAALRPGEQAMLLWALSRLQPHGHTSKPHGHTSKSHGHTSKPHGHTSQPGGHTSKSRSSLAPVAGMVLLGMWGRGRAGGVLSPQDLSLTLSALATAHVRPSDQFLQALMGPAYQVRCGRARASASVHGSSNGPASAATASAAAKARAPASTSADAKTASSGRATQPQCPAPAVQVAAFKARELCHLLWALARLHVRMSGPWLLSVCRQLQSELRSRIRGAGDAAGMQQQGMGNSAGSSGSSSDGSSGRAAAGAGPHAAARPGSGVRLITEHAPGSALVAHDCEMGAKALKQLAALSGIHLADPGAPSRAAPRTLQADDNVGAAPRGRGSAAAGAPAGAGGVRKAVTAQPDVIRAASTPAKAVAAVAKSTAAVAAVAVGGKASGAGVGDTGAAQMGAWVAQEVQVTLAELGAVRQQLLVRTQDARRGALARKLTYAAW